jgi:hypothetical protein
MYHNYSNKLTDIKRVPNEDLTKFCFRMVDSIDAKISYWDAKEVCRFANNSFLKLPGISRSKIIEEITMKELFGHFYPEIKPYIKKVLEGKKQVFEFDWKDSKDSHHHYIVTYKPDKANGKVAGFYVQMADINSVKKSGTKLLDSEKARRRELLRSVIDTQESERELIAYELRDKVNQTLAYTKMMLGTAVSKNRSDILLVKISENIHQTIDELNRISTDLTPSIITMIGFLAGVKEYIGIFEKRHHLKIVFKCPDEKIEQMSVSDKISVFRIIQNYLLLLAGNGMGKNTAIDIRRLNSTLVVKMQTNETDFELALQSREFLDIAHRLEYYNGTWRHFKEGNKKILLIELEMF